MPGREVLQNLKGPLTVTRIGQHNAWSKLLQSWSECSIVRLKLWVPVEAASGSSVSALSWGVMARATVVPGQAVLQSVAGLTG